jgi:hypothetical protein
LSVVCFRLRISIEVWQTYLGVVTIWKGADEGVRMGNLGCLLNLIGGGIAAIQYVVFDAPLKQGGLLAHKANLAPQPLHIQVSDVFAIKQNFTCKIQIF